MTTLPAIAAALTIHGRALPDSNRPLHGLSDRIAEMAAKAAAAALGIVKPDQQIPLPKPTIFPPHHDSNQFGSTYYGIMIPDLPAPHQFLSFAAILGMIGIKSVDNDHAVTRDGPRYTAFVFNTSAAPTEQPFASYSMRKDMKLAADGSSISFGRDAELSGSYPNFRLRSMRKDFSVNLTITATGDTTWIAHSESFQHLSLLMRYSGFIDYQGQSIEVAGLGTWDYWRAATPYLPIKQFLPVDHKAEGDLLSHHVINLDENTQYVLYFVTLMDCTLTCTAYKRVVGEGSYMLDADVHFQVLSAQPTPAIGPDGYAMTLPATFRWTINCRRSPNHLTINGVVDTPMVYGIAAGYAGGYTWTGNRNGVEISGRGYLSYVDKRD